MLSTAAAKSASRPYLRATSAGMDRSPSFDTHPPIRRLAGELECGQRGGRNRPFVTGQATAFALECGRDDDRHDGLAACHSAAPRTTREEAVHVNGVGRAISIIDAGCSEEAAEVSEHSVDVPLVDVGEGA